MKKLLLILLLFAGAVHAAPVSFYGDFFDFLVTLSLKSGVECGIDPYALATVPALTGKMLVFQQGDQESMDSFLDRIGKEQGLSVQKIGPYRYFTTSQQSANESVFAEALFAKRDDIMSAASGLRRQLGANNGTIGPLVSEMLKSEDEKNQLMRDAQLQIQKVRLAYSRGDGLARGSALSKPDQVGAKLAYEEGNGDLDDVTRMFNDSIDGYKRAADFPSEAFNKAEDLLPGSLVKEAYYRTMYNRLEPCLYILDQVSKFYTNTAEMSELTDRLKRMELTLSDSISESRKLTKTGEETYATAYQLWANKDYAGAYKQYSLLFDVIEDYSAKTRLGCALLAVKTYVSKVQSLQALMASPQAGKQSSPIDVQGLQGIDDAMAAAISKYLNVTIRPFEQGDTENPARLGASYGLVVVPSLMQGRIASFGVQFLAKKENGGTAGGDAKPQPGAQTGNEKPKLNAIKLDEVTGGDFEIELQAQGDAKLDEYSMASISDALRYVQANQVNDLASKRILIILDKTVAISYGGDSGGAAISMACISRALGKEPRPNLCMTGAVRAYGDVRPIGGLLLKTRAAADSNFGVMLVPEGNLADLKLLDMDTLGGLQIIMGRTMADYIHFALPPKDDDRKQADAVFKAYALGYVLYKAGDYPEALSALKSVLQACPDHFSAISLVKLMEMAGVKPKPLPAELAQYAAIPQGSQLAQ